MTADVSRREVRLWNALIVVGLIISVCSSVGLLVERHERRAFDDRRAYDICVSQSEGRQVLREFVVYVMTQPVGTDLAFVETDNAEIQSVLDQITARSAEAPTAEEIEATLARLPLPDCDALRDGS